jgi:hypothetical protein
LEGGLEVEVWDEFEAGLPELSAHKLGSDFQDCDSVCLLLVGEKGERVEACIMAVV